MQVGGVVVQLGLPVEGASDSFVGRLNHLSVSNIKRLKQGWTWVLLNYEAHRKLYKKRYIAGVTSYIYGYFTITDHTWYRLKHKRLKKDKN